MILGTVVPFAHVQNKLCGRPPQYACPRPCDLDLLPFDLGSGVRVTCDVVYLCANFSLLVFSVLDLGPMYATDVRQHHRLMPLH